DRLRESFSPLDHERPAAMDDVVDAARPEVTRGLRHLRESLFELVRLPAVDVAGHAHEPDAVRREAVELVRHDFHHRRSDIADALAPAEHAPFRDRLLLDHKVRTSAAIATVPRPIASNGGVSAVARG